MIYADGGYADRSLKGANARRVGKFTLEIIKRTDHHQRLTRCYHRRWVDVRGNIRMARKNAGDWTKELRKNQYASQKPGSHNKSKPTSPTCYHRVASSKGLEIATLLI